MNFFMKKLNNILRNNALSNEKVKKILKSEIDLYDDVYNDVNNLSLSSYNLVGSKLEVDLMDESNIFNQICDDSSEENFAFSIIKNHKT